MAANIGLLSNGVERSLRWAKMRFSKIGKILGAPIRSLRPVSECVAPRSPATSAQKARPPLQSTWPATPPSSSPPGSWGATAASLSVQFNIRHVVGKDGFVSIDTKTLLGLLCIRRLVFFPLTTGYDDFLYY